MTRRKDLTNLRFGRLVVVGFSHTDKRGKALWQCLCDCGKATIVQANKLTGNRSKSCGCARVLARTHAGSTIRNEHGNLISDISGQVFGQLTVIRYSHTDTKRGSYWLARCTCGNEKVMAAGSLRSKGSNSCGCLMGSAVTSNDKFLISGTSKRRINDISGQKFGKLTVDTYSHVIGKKHFWVCICECGNTITADTCSLRTGNTQSCGCIKGLNLRKDVMNQRFGRLVVLSFDENRSADSVRTYRVCRCDCGNVVSVQLGLLTLGHTQSCGCLHAEVSSVVGSEIGIKNCTATSRYNWHIDRESGRTYLRSGFELIYAQYLVRNNIEFEYEPKTFELAPSVRYRPDFYLTSSCLWVEVKGYLSPSFHKKKMLFEQFVGQNLIMVTQNDLIKYLPDGLSYYAWMKQNAHKYLR